MKQQLRIGSRTSPLARKQAQLVCEALQNANPQESFEFEHVGLKTQGDQLKDVPLTEFGGKGLFTRELDDALLKGKIDIAVHSAKDLPTLIPEGIVISAYLQREDPRDALITKQGKHYKELPEGAVIGTASLRRQAQLYQLRPDFKYTLIRGNVETRLNKMDNGHADATLLAVAGLKRGGFLDKAAYIFSTEEMLPAIGQGAIALCMRHGDPVLHTLVQSVNHPETYQCLLAERVMLRRLDGSCRTPIAGYAIFQNNEIYLRGFHATLDGKQAYMYAARHEDPLYLGAYVADQLKLGLQKIQNEA